VTIKESSLKYLLKYAIVRSIFDWPVLNEKSSCELNLGLTINLKERHLHP